MKKEEKKDTTLSRRSFLRGAATTGVALGVTAITGCGDDSSSGSSTPVTKWDKEADVVVLGYGGGGAVTAITAHDAGAEVVILEKAPSEGGGNTRMAGGVVVWPSDVTKAAEHMSFLSWGATPDDICQVWATEGNKNKAWFDEMGVKYTLQQNTAEFKNLPGADAINTLAVTGNGLALWKALDGQVKQRGIEVMFGTPAIRLVQNTETKEILGVVAKNGDTELNIKARKAVVICTGGFEYDEKKKLNFLRAYPVHFYGWKYNTGDGIDMAQQVGAGLWHMSTWSGRCVPWFPDHEIAWMFSGPRGQNFVYVDKYGKRYGNERSSGFGHNWWNKLTDFDIEEPAYTRIPGWMIFDETTRLAGPVTAATANSGITSIPKELGGADPWSSDNSAEIAAGKILKGNTIAELAQAIISHPTTALGQAGPGAGGKYLDAEQLDAATLQKTIDTYNQYCAAGEDPDFERPASTLQPIVTAPFYAVKMWPGGPNTQGGPIRNAKAQVCDYQGNPIPRLYSNGECGSVYGFLYPTGGGNICELVSFGRIAGTNAAAEAEWTK